jgi:CO dehydrogenase nickel-insertion accessory protein CooC1
VISDDTKVGAETAVRILKLAQDMGIEIGNATLVLNKVKGDVHQKVKDIAQESPFEHVVVLPYDKDVERASIEGRSVLEISDANPFYVKVRALATEL